MKAKQLELNYKEEELADRVRDYKAVADQLKVEGDAPRQNQLKDQLKILGQQIEQLENEIKELKQAIAQADEQIVSDTLSCLLQAHESQFEDILNAYQWILVNRRYSSTSEPRNSQAIITELLKIPQGQSKHKAIEQFTACLVCCSHNSALLIALQNWGKQHVPGWNELIEWVKNQQEQQAQNAQPVVLVAINRSDEASTQEQEGNRYQIKAWLIQDIEQHKLQQQSYRPIELSGETGDEAYLLEELKARTSQLLTRILEEGSSEFPDEPEIHIFLPVELMNENVDCWLLESSYGRPKPLGHEYKVVLRCAERASRSYRQRPRWNKKWQHYQSLLQKKAFEVFTPGDDSDLDELSYTLDEVEDTIVGLKVRQAPVQVDADGLFGVLLQSGLPLAVWGRCDLRGAATETELDRVLQACCLEKLPHTVKQERRQSRNKDKDCHIGHHLSLLWDDPNVLPPKSA